jgi:SAM-dependent methyltransferase
VLAHFVDRFERALGVDISPRMLAVAAARQLPRVELLQGSCFELSGPVTGKPARDANTPPRGPVGPAGAVFSRGILLSHYGQRWAVPLLRQIREVLLADGGFAILDFLNAVTRSDYLANPDNKTYFMPAQMLSYTNAAGFRRATILGEPSRRVLLLLAER